MAGRPVESWQNALEIYLRERAKRVKPYTVRKYRWNFSKFFVALEKAGLETNPSLIGEAEILHLLDVEWANLQPGTRRWYAATFSMFLQRFGNKIIEDMNLRFPQDTRVNVDWLDESEIVQLLDAGLSPLELIVIHLELCLGLRNVEVKRLRVQDINFRRGYIEVRGKGSDDGKWRTVPFHPDTAQVLSVWMAERDRMIAEAQQYRPNIAVPDNLVIWKRYVKKPEIGAYSEDSNGLTKVTIRRVRKRLGLKFANHTLRRTCGRSLWLSDDKVPIETISQIYGHSDGRTTKGYIGVNVDDMAKAMTSLSKYQNDLRTKFKGDK